MPGAIVIAELNETIDRVLGPLLPRGSRCALLDFPNYANVGDNAIWLGELAWLRRAGVEIVYQSDQVAYSRDELRARIGDGTILLSGGGNFGDLWPAHQWFREEVVSAFPGRRIVQLPQTIRFTEPPNLERARAVFARHPDVVVLVRDTESLDADIGAELVLCPDMAFALGALERPFEPTRDVVWLLRADHESALGADVEGTDWPDDESEEQPPRSLATLRRLQAAHGPGHGVGELLAKARLERGLATLSEGRVIVTDRLHGHVLSLLLGIPHAVLDTRHGKLRGFYDAWTRRSELAHWADSPADALERIAA